MYPGYASYDTPQNNEHILPTYFNHGMPHTPSNSASYYPPSLPPPVHTDALPQFTTPNALQFQPLDTPIQGKKRKRPTTENQESRQRTPIRPLKGRELHARVQYLDDEIAQLKKDTGELTRERALLGSAPESRGYSSRSSEKETLQAVFSAISSCHMLRFALRATSTISELITIAVRPASRDCLALGDLVTIRH